MTHDVIVTRAEPGAAQTAARVTELGFRAIISPSLSLAPIEPMPEIDTAAQDGLIFTSANGVRFFAEARADRDLTAWCVGPATHEAATVAGFGDIRDANGDAGDLFDLVATTGNAADRLLHVANEAAAGDLVARLNSAGRTVSFCALYRTTPTRVLTPRAVSALETGTIVLIHSAKGAAGFLAACGDVSLENAVCVAVSTAASAPLIGQGAAKIICASRPNEAALMTALQTAALSL